MIDTVCYSDLIIFSLIGTLIIKLLFFILKSEDLSVYNIIIIYIYFSIFIITNIHFITYVCSDVNSFTHITCFLCLLTSNIITFIIMLFNTQKSKWTFVEKIIFIFYNKYYIIRYIYENKYFFISIFISTIILSFLLRYPFFVFLGVKWSLVGYCYRIVIIYSTFIYVQWIINKLEQNLKPNFNNNSLQDFNVSKLGVMIFIVLLCYWTRYYFLGLFFFIYYDCIFINKKSIIENIFKYSSYIQSRENLIFRSFGKMLCSSLGNKLSYSAMSVALLAGQVNDTSIDDDDKSLYADRELHDYRAVVDRYFFIGRPDIITGDKNFLELYSSVKFKPDSNWPDLKKRGYYYDADNNIAYPEKYKDIIQKYEMVRKTKVKSGQGKKIKTMNLPEMLKHVKLGQDAYYVMVNKDEFVKLSTVKGLRSLLIN